MTGTPFRGLPVPEEMKSWRQFVVWQLTPTRAGGKPTKLPYNPLTGTLASTIDPSTWGSYDEACAAYFAGGYSGIGFVFTRDDPFFFLDLDGCRDPVSGELTEDAQRVVESLNGAAVEVSQSKKGLHVVGRCNKAALSDRRNKWDGKEFYLSERFMALGGGEWIGQANGIDWTSTIETIVPPRDAAGHARPPDWWQDKPRDGYSGPDNDDELLRRMSDDRRPSAMFESKASFADLWDANPETLAKFFPPTGSDPFDHSAADQALLSHLAFWTGCNPVRMERLFNESRLCKRDKWRLRQDYRERSIWAAIEDPARTYLNIEEMKRERRREQIKKNIEIGDDPTNPALPSVMTLDEMKVGLVYVGNGGAVVHKDSGRIRNRDDARTEFAASTHSFDTGKKGKDGMSIIKTVPALPLWLKSPERISVDTLIWDPSQLQIGNALEQGNAGYRAYNTYRRLQVSTPPTNWREWVAPLLEHIEYLVPIEDERNRFLQWLAHIFQKPAELPQTAYLMVARVTGIGRGTLGSILTRALRGQVASNVQLSKILDGGFNGRLSQKLLATVDEIRQGNSVNKYQQAEALKSMITEEYRHINPKYGVETVERNCMRWLIFSNYMDALPFDAGDRRMIVIENPSIRRSEAIFANLHKLMDMPEFIASIQHYMLTLDISTFKAGEHAPMSPAKASALSALESDADKSAREFREEWPAEVATTADLAAFIGQDVPKGMALKHVIERAGMFTGRKIRIGGRSETILVIRGIGQTDLANASNERLVSIVISGRCSFDRGPAVPVVPVVPVVPRL